MILELQNLILEMIATGEPLPSTIRRLCVEVERMAEGTVCSVLTVDDGHLHPLAGPSLPDSYSSALDNLEIGPLVGSCGTAAYFALPVAVTDIEHDPRWTNFRHLAMPLGFKACWSTPIISGNRVVATFAFYFHESRGPTDLEQQIVDACVHLCSIAIEREHRVQERQRLTYVDALTGLHNRASFNRALAERVSDDHEPWAILLADVDNLKVVNDTFGHAAGDDLIRTVGHRIASVMAPDKVFRIGGDEFAILLDGVQSPALTEEAAKVLDIVKSPAPCGRHVVVPGISIGGTLAEQDQSPDEVRQCADIALYHAKDHGRGRFVEYSHALGTGFTRRFRAIRDVSHALTEDRIDAHYQPIVRLDTGEVVGFEALCRMNTNSGEIIAAANFHEATKDAHVAADLTQCMLLKVARDIRRWLDQGLPFQHVGINLAAADFHSGSLQDRLCKIFSDAGVPLKHVILEVTESVYLGQRDHVVADEIRLLRERGMRVALDDFGTGFASLTHLLTVPVDIIKIDKSFVERLVHGDGAVVIVEGVISIARKLGLRVVAEGVETDDQLKQLLSFGCTLGQGYLFSKALDRDAATALLSRYGQHHTTPSRAIRA